MVILTPKVSQSGPKGQKTRNIKCLSALVLQIVDSLAALAASTPLIAIPLYGAESGCDMACFYPLEGWKANNPNDSGKYPVTFRLREGNPDSPLGIACGKCIGCQRDRANAWGIRCYHESLLHLQNSFVTLTYDNSHCPDRVKVDDLQKFLKRLRKMGLKFRYFGCGEHGGLTARPHYHVLFFGQDFLDWSFKPFGKNRYYECPKLDEIWGMGHTLLAPMEPGSIFYTAGYQLKNLDDKDAFHVASKRPFIGAEFLKKHAEDVSNLGFIVINGKQMPIPKAYLLRDEYALEMDSVKEARRAHIEARTPEQTWQERTKARGRETNLIASLGVTKRSKV